MKKFFLLLCFLAIYSASAQKKDYEFGSISQSDKDLKVYAKDSSANAVFIYEKGETDFKQTSNDIVIKTTYYAKIKFFNKEGFDNATVEIPLYNNSQTSEKVENIKAVTHNGGRKIFLNKKNIFREKIDENWTLVKFTLPDVQEQSIIEYEYVFETPFKFNFKGWEFQAEIPKIHSKFHALIPGNYVYNRSLVGYKLLDTNIADIKRSCFSISGYSAMADCEDLTYAMKDVPAFIEEDYMTTKKNHLSAIKFELQEYKSFTGGSSRFTKTWKDVDKEFRAEKTVGRQLRKVDYLEKNIPIEILQTSDKLERAKKIYYFITNHFNWNGEIRLFKEVDVKKAFDSKIGNSTEINIALINALNAADIDVSAMLISTRNHGLPTKVHPVITDFNYIIAKLDIDGKTYLLDATNKQLPFGILPTRCLNGYGRVMDFKNDSYWMDIVPVKNSRTLLSLNIELNDDGNFTGLLHKSYDGYDAIEKRNEIISKTEEEYLTDFENKINDIEVNSYENYNIDVIEETFKELFDITIESNLNNNLLILNPFLISRIKENPFKLKIRSYPVDFAYPRAINYNLSLKIPESYKVKSLPEDVLIKLPNDGGMYIYRISESNGQITMIIRMSLSRNYFIPDEYYALKEFYNQIIKNQNSLITLEKL